MEIDTAFGLANRKRSRIRLRGIVGVAPELISAARFDENGWLNNELTAWPL